MTLFNSILLGIIQGLAEFLPISSSGHLAIFQEVLNIQNAGMVFDIMLHFGTLVAIVFAFWNDIKKLFVEGVSIIRDFFINVYRFFANIGRKKSQGLEYVEMVKTPYRKFVMLVIVSTIPTAIIGVLLDSVIEEVSSSLLIVGICLLVTSFLLFVADNCNVGNKRPKNIKYREAGIVGIVQGMAVLPGISRSGSTITACLLCGFDKNFAVKYSFIMSIPTVVGAVVLKIKDFASLTITSTEMLYYAIGTVVAAVIGYICIKTMLVLVRGKKFKGFSIYCLIVGLFSIVYYFV